MTFDEAVRYAIEQRGAAYSYFEAGRSATLWVVAYEPEHEQDPEEFEECYAHVLAGPLASSSMEGGVMSLDDMEPDARQLTYVPATAWDPSFMDYQLRIAVALIRGASEHEALRVL